MIKYLGHKVDIIDESDLKRRNKNRSWHYGYDAEHDMIIISKDGTVGDVYQMDFFDLRIALPKCPPKIQVPNESRPKKYQKWKREELPNGINAENWEDDRFYEYTEQQAKFREEGYWCFINGDPIYMTGTYWFFLQWVRIEEDYPNFRQIQNEYMIYWEACKADHRCYGMIYTKNRRMGATSMGVAELLCSGTFFREKRLGIMSKTGKDSKEVFDRVVTAFKRLPPFFQPKIDGTSTPKSELIFREPTQKMKKGEKITADSGMNTIISHYNTALNSMDGMRMFRALLDESSKYPKDVPFNRFWNIVKTSFIKGRIIFGKAMVVSTVNAMQDGGEAYKEVYYNSKQRDENEETISGLYPIFISAEYCLEGFFDEYGMSIVDDPEKPIMADAGGETKIGSKTRLNNKMKALEHKPEELNEQLRQFPLEEKDAFRDSADNCYFNLIKLEEQVAYNTEELDDDKYGNNDVIRGNLAWLNGQRHTKAVWHPDPVNGKFWVKKGCLPPPEMQNQKHLKFAHGISAYAPGNEALGCIGVDPFNREKTSDGRGSNGAMHLYTRYNALGFPNNTFIMEYIERPKKIEVFYEDVMLAMSFWSVPIFPELSSERFSHTLIENGYRHFIKNNPFKKWSELTSEEKKCGGVNAQNVKFREEQYQAINSYIQDSIGVARIKTDEREIGDMGDMPFTRTLKEWIKTDPNNRTDFDAYISSSLACLGCQSPIKIEVEESEPITIPFRTYDNSGLISVAQ